MGRCVSDQIRLGAVVTFGLKAYVRYAPTNSTGSQLTRSKQPKYASHALLTIMQWGNAATPALTTCASIMQPRNWVCEEII